MVFDLCGKESKANVYGNDMFIQLFYTLYLIYMEKKVKQMFMEMICLYNCFIRCIGIERKRMQSKCLWK